MKVFGAPAARVGLTLVVLLVVAAALAPLLFPTDPTEMSLTSRLQPPSAEHFFGTDAFGRDVLARVVYGARVSLLVGVLAVASGGLSGTVLGSASGFYGGWIDQVLMRIVDALQSFPAVLLAMAIIGVLGPGLVNLMLAVGLTSVPGFARIARGTVLTVRGLDYVAAARVIGARPNTILWRHVFPNSASPVVVTGTLQIASAILAAASLSFLGLGIQPPTPEWGSMLADGRAQIIRAPWISIFPGLAIMLTVVGFNLLGDALRDALDPTTQVVGGGARR